MKGCYKKKVKYGLNEIFSVLYGSALYGHGDKLNVYRDVKTAI